MGENYIIFIAPINKWNPISRPDKVRLQQNQSISLILSEIYLLSELGKTKTELVRHHDIIEYIIDTYRVHA